MSGFDATSTTKGKLTRDRQRRARCQMFLSVMRTRAPVSGDDDGGQPGYRTSDIWSQDRWTPAIGPVVQPTGAQHAVTVDRRRRK